MYSGKRGGSRGRIRRMSCLHFLTLYVGSHYTSPVPNGLRHHAVMYSYNEPKSLSLRAVKKTLRAHAPFVFFAYGLQYPHRRRWCTSPAPAWAPTAAAEVDLPSCRLESVSSRQVSHPCRQSDTVEQGTWGRGSEDHWGYSLMCE